MNFGQSPEEQDRANNTDPVLHCSCSETLNFKSGLQPTLTLKTLLMKLTLAIRVLMFVLNFLHFSGICSLWYYIGGCTESNCWYRPSDYHVWKETFYIFQHLHCISKLVVAFVIEIIFSVFDFFLVNCSVGSVTISLLPSTSTFVHHFQFLYILYINLNYISVVVVLKHVILKMMYNTFRMCLYLFFNTAVKVFNAFGEPRKMFLDSDVIEVSGVLS